MQLSYGKSSLCGIMMALAAEEAQSRVLVEGDLRLVLFSAVERRGSHVFSTSPLLKIPSSSTSEKSGECVAATPYASSSTLPLEGYHEENIAL